MTEEPKKLEAYLARIDWQLNHAELTLNVTHADLSPEERRKLLDFGWTYTLEPKP